MNRDSQCLTSLAGADGFQNSYEASFVGGDRSRDVAVVKIGADQVRASLQDHDHHS